MESFDLVPDKRLDVKVFRCNAANGYPGVNGIIGTGMELYMRLTGDRFWNPRDTPDTATVRRQLLGR